jgi:hypothetical protein
MQRRNQGNRGLYLAASSVIRGKRVSSKNFYRFRASWLKDIRKKARCPIRFVAEKAGEFLREVKDKHQDLKGDIGLQIRA